MDKKSGSGIISTIIDLFVAYMKRITDLLHLAALEAQLAFKTLIILAILVFLLTSIITASWLSLLALLFVYLLSIHCSSLTACAIVVAVNFIALTAIFYIIYKIKDNLFFPSTRRQLHPQQLTEEEMKHERITTQN